MEFTGGLLISFVNDGTIIVQSPAWNINLFLLEKKYMIIFQLTQAMGLELEYNKSEVFHFSRKYGDDNLPVDIGFNQP